MARRRSRKTSSEPNLLGPLFTATAKLVFAALLVAGLVEAGAALALKAMDDEAAQPPALHTPEDLVRLYDSEDYRRYGDALAETMAAARPAYRPFVESVAAPHAGRHLNVSAEGWRAGGRAASLAGEGAKVFVFGGSTAFGLGVPDAETLPARMEDALRDVGREARVFNFAAPGHFSTPQRILLESLLAAGHQPDVAIFVDGLGDFTHCGAPERGTLSQALGKGLQGEARKPLAAEIVERSHLGRLLAGPVAEIRPEATEPCADADQVAWAARRLDANRRMIAGIADAFGFKVLFVQQPVPTHGHDNSRRPVALPEGALAPFEAAGKGVAVLAEMRQAGALFERNLLWLADARPEANAYVDAIHYSPAFNQMLGRTIAQHLVETGLLP